MCIDMGRGRGSSMFLLTLELQVALWILQLYAFPVVDSKCTIFNFGDSNSDTGGLSAGFGFYLGPPSGREFFHRTTGRFCDGRLYIDFLCQDLEINFLSHYLESSGSDFAHGVNFAVAGAVTVPNANQFPLPTQVSQFLHFKNRTRELRLRGLGSRITEEDFGNAVYIFDMGQNDVATPFDSNLSYSEAIATIPSTLSNIKDAIEKVYENGGTKFWIYNVGPLGCLPQKLALQQQVYSELDPQGCLAAHNNASKAFNAGLSDLSDELRSKFENATVVYIDMFSIKYDLIVNHAKYGFENPLMACCGHGGPPYNYAFRMTCGQLTATACPEGSRYISWDGVHFTDAANAIIASKILSGNYTSPQTKLKSLCKL